MSTSRKPKNRSITVESVVADLERASADLSFLGMYDDAEDVNRTIRFITGAQTPVQY